MGDVFGKNIFVVRTLCNYLNVSKVQTQIFCYEDNAQVSGNKIDTGDQDVLLDCLYYQFWAQGLEGVLQIAGNQF